MLVVSCTKRNRLAIDNSSSPRGLFDFINGIYYFDATTYTAAQAISDTGQITANGLEVNTSGLYPNAPSILAAEVQNFLDTAQVSGVIQFEGVSPGGYLIEWSEWFSGDYVSIQWWQDAEAWDSNNLDGTREALDSTNGTAFGVHKMAFTRLDAKISVSIDGFPAVSDSSFSVALPDPRDTQSDDEGMTTRPMDSFNNYHLGGQFTDGFNGSGTPNGGKVIIKSIAFYDTLTDTQLATLSA